MGDATERRTTATHIARSGMFRIPDPPRPWPPHYAIAYGLSLPERLGRTAVGWAGGLVFSLSRLLPGPVRKSRFYRVAVMKMLQVLIDGIGQASVFAGQQVPSTQGYVPRKIIGSVIDNASIVLFHVSPIWILLVLSDVLHGSKLFLNEVTDELKKAGVLDPDSRIRDVEGLLNQLSNVSGDVAESLDTPPLSIDQMRSTFDELKAKAESINLRAMLPEEELNRLALELRQVADVEQRSILEMSTGVATYALGKAVQGAYGAGMSLLKGVEVGAKMAWREIIGDYIEGLQHVRRCGFESVIAEGLAPFKKALANNFNPKIVTYTEVVLSFGRFKNAPWRVRPAVG